MPYNVHVYKQSPYNPGAEVLDQPPEWTESFTHNGERIHYRGMSGVPVDDPAHAPSRFRLEIAAARLPDVFVLSSGWGVSDLVRDMVEELEPGVHQFLPAEITAKGRERPEKRYWFLHICNRVDAIDPDKSVLRVDDKGRYHWDRLPAGEQARMVLRKEVIAGKCLWIDRRWLPRGVFMSDELFDFLTEGKRKDFIGPPGTFIGGGKRTKFISWKVLAE